MEGTDPAIAAALDGLDEDGILGGVAERVPQSHDCAADALFEIDKHIRWPKRLAEFFAGDDLSRTAEEQCQSAEGQVLETHLHSVAAKFARAQICFEQTEADECRRRLRRTHRLRNNGGGPRESNTGWGHTGRHCFAGNKLL